MAHQSDLHEADFPELAGHPAAVLDDLDRRLLGRLLTDARTSVRALAEQLHISRANAYARMQRLREEGVLLGFRAVLSPERAGLGTSAYVSIAIEQNTWREVAARLRALAYVEHIALVAGEADVLVLVRAPDNQALRAIVFSEIQSIPGVTSTRTWLVFEEHDGAGVPWG
jgi:DNA-binding Lrp family transcriptional regulator